MKIVLRILFSVAFLGSLYWIRAHPEEPEPYISTILGVAALLGTFYESKRKETIIVVKIIRRRVIRNNRYVNNHYLVIRNEGDYEANDILIHIPSRESYSSPLVDDRGERGTLKIPVLHPNQNYEAPLAVSFDTGDEFDVTWSWITSKGKRAEKKGILRPEGE